MTLRALGRLGAGLALAAVVGCSSSGSTPPATSTPPPIGSQPPSSAPAGTGQPVAFTTQGYSYTVVATSPVATATEISSPYLVSSVSAPGGEQLATVTIDLTNAMTDRSVPLQIATDGDIDFSFALPFSDSAGLSGTWSGDCKEPIPSTTHGLCVDQATRVQATSPSHVDETEPRIPAGGTVTMHLYSTAFPSSVALTELQLIYVNPDNGDQIQIPLSN